MCVVQFQVTSSELQGKTSCKFQVVSCRRNSCPLSVHRSPKRISSKFHVVSCKSKSRYPVKGDEPADRWKDRWTLKSREPAGRSKNRCTPEVPLYPGIAVLSQPSSVLRFFKRFGEFPEHSINAFGLLLD